MSTPSCLKAQTLKANGTFNHQAQRVRDTLFQQPGFFDPHDQLQVKYEMLRRVQVEGWTVAQAAAVFGFSRLSFYHAQRAFEQYGLSGLVARKRGPKRGHKLTLAVMKAIQGWRAEEPQVSAQTLAERLAQQLQVSVHPRSIERTLARWPQKGGPTRA
jgi:transposase